MKRVMGIKIHKIAGIGRYHGLELYILDGEAIITIMVYDINGLENNNPPQ
jgi:hypothetical protein